MLIYPPATDFIYKDFIEQQNVAVYLDVSSKNLIDLQKGLYKEENDLEKLRKDLGDDLYNSLTFEDKKFIIDTEGVVDFGFKITSDNFNDIEKILREDYAY